MLRPRLLLLAVLGTLASSAHGGVIGVRTIIPAFSGVDAALTGHTGLVLNLMTDDGSFITAIDVTIGGTLHQRWTVDPDIPETMPTPLGVSLTNGDSHLTAPSSALFVVAPTEDNTGAGSPLADTATRDYGYGTTLHAVWGILGGNQSTQASVAYVVVPHGAEQSLRVTGQVATTAGSYPMPIFMLPIEQHSHASPTLGSELSFGPLTPAPRQANNTSRSPSANATDSMSQAMNSPAPTPTSFWSAACRASRSISIPRRTPGALAGTAPRRVRGFMKHRFSFTPTRGCFRTRSRR